MEDMGSLTSLTRAHMATVTHGTLPITILADEDLGERLA